MIHTQSECQIVLPSMGLIRGEPEAQAAWRAIAQYHHFLVEHHELYHDVESVARIALLSSEPHNRLADEFLKESVIFETKVLTHLDGGVNLDQFKVLVMPADLRKLTHEQKLRLNSFAAGGGVIISGAKAGVGIGCRAEAAAGGLALDWSRAHTCWAS